MPSNRLESTTPWLNFLVAYPYCKQPIFDVLKTQTTPYRFLLDSGAFTAHSLGKTIRLDVLESHFIQRISSCGHAA